MKGNKKYMTDNTEEVKPIEEKYYVLYMACTIWKMRQEILNHLEIASKSEEWQKHINIHLCNIDSMEILMQVIKHWFPEIYQAKGKSILQHLEEAQALLEKDFFNRRYDGLSSTLSQYKQHLVEQLEKAYPDYPTSNQATYENGYNEGHNTAKSRLLSIIKGGV